MQFGKVYTYNTIVSKVAEAPNLDKLCHMYLLWLRLRCKYFIVSFKINLLL